MEKQPNNPHYHHKEERCASETAPLTTRLGCHLCRLLLRSQQGTSLLLNIVLSHILSKILIEIRLIASHSKQGGLPIPSGARPLMQPPNISNLRISGFESSLEYQRQLFGGCVVSGTSCTC
jgi:hypothetical protein